MSNVQVAAGYIRVSTGRQAREGKSLQFQEEIIRQQAKINGETIYKIYKDEGISGASIEKREGLKSMLADLKKGDTGVSKVYIWDLSRLTRSQIDIYRITDELHSHNIELVSLNNQGADFTTASGRLMTGIYGSINEFFRYNLKQNVIEGMKSRSKNGYTSSKAALGYERGNSSKDPLQINDHEAGIIRLIFDLAESGHGYRAIANTLNQKNYLTKNGNPFDTGAVKYILNNKLYSGLVVWGMYRDFANVGRAKPGTPLITEGKHEAIITKDQFERVQQVLKARSKQPIRTGKSSLLGSLLRCKQCSGPMEISHNTSRRKNQPDVRYRLYSCARSRRSGSSVCSANSIRADEIEPIVKDLFLQLINNDTLLEKVVHEANTLIETQNNVRPMPNKKLQNDIDDLISKITQLQIVAKTDESLTEVLAQPLEEYTTKLKRKQQRQNDTVTVAEKTYYKYSVDNLPAALEGVKRALSGENTGLIKKAYSQIIERIEFKKVGRRKVEEVKIYLYPDVAALIEQRNEVEGPNGSSAFLFSQGIVLSYAGERYKVKVKNIL